MSVIIQEGKILYHLTSIDNLENGLLSPKDVLDKNLIKDNVADSAKLTYQKCSGNNSFGIFIIGYDMGGGMPFI